MNDQGRTWRKSSRSSPDGNCVELACEQEAVQFVRDSKNPDGPMLSCPPAALAAFLGAVRKGHLDG